jgi:2-polyprenyl-3-methyl-5-hydroxy-6-metoxy-1,4-benzoquinol methylase
MCVPVSTAAAAVAPTIDAWLDDAHHHLRNAAPDLAAIVDDYVGDARFGAATLAGDLAAIAPGGHILEVGAGAGLLSTALQAVGYTVTALEPVGEGFSHMTRLRSLVEAHASRHGVQPTSLAVPAEDLAVTQAYDLAFSINVMEHVGDVAAVLRRVFAALRPGASYRFVCPNYHFPYEPHFGLPTLGSKALTWRVFERRIMASRVVVDPAGTWASLNWISVAQVRDICRRDLQVAPVFDRTITARFLQRAFGDASFQRRHGGTLRAAARLVERGGLTRLATLVPPGLQPAMSCRITRPH